MNTLLSTTHADRSLAERLERAEGHANAAMVRTRAVLEPACGAETVEIAGARAMYDGADSPLTQTFGLGLERVPHDAEWAALEAFFRSRGAPVFHEVCPLAEPGLLNALAARGYNPVEMTTVLYQPVPDPAPNPVDSVVVRLAAEDEADLWAAVAAAGWTTEAPGLAEFVLNLGVVMARTPQAYCFLAEIDGWPVATGALMVHEGVALLAGSSTVPRRRRCGAQNALLRARLAFGADCGCDVAMVVTAPGSASQRNAERRGFRVAYTRTKWGLDVH